MNEDIFADQSLSQTSIKDPSLKVKVIGIGGAGGNTVDRLRMESSAHVHLAVVNTDARALAASPVTEKIQIGRKITYGLGTGGDLAIGQKAAIADRDHLSRLTDGVDLVFLIVGLGGGTGSGAAPLIAELARDNGALVITFATLPFKLEGERKIRVAEEAKEALNQHCDALITLPNDILFQDGGEHRGVLEAFSKADEWMAHGIHSICAMLFNNGLITIDFASLKKAFPGPGGKTVFGVGTGEGPDCVEAALESLDQCPLLNLSKVSAPADALLINIVGGTDLEMSQVQKVLDFVTQKLGSRDQNVFGAVIDEEKRNSLEICVMGMTDLGNQKFLPTQKAPEADSFNHSEVFPQEPALVGSNPKKSKKAVAAKKAEQAEFDILIQGEDRGFFRDTRIFRHKEEDLDVPTYLRRGIKIPSSDRG